MVVGILEIKEIEIKISEKLPNSEFQQINEFSVLRVKE